MAEMKSGSTAEGPYLLGMDIGTGGVRVGIFSRISRAGAYLWAPVISFALIHASAWKGNSAKFAQPRSYADNTRQTYSGLSWDRPSGPRLRAPGASRHGVFCHVLRRALHHALHHALRRGHHRDLHQALPHAPLSCLGVDLSYPGAPLSCLGVRRPSARSPLRSICPPCLPRSRLPDRSGLPCLLCPWRNSSLGCQRVFHWAKRVPLGRRK